MPRIAIMLPLSLGLVATLLSTGVRADPLGPVAQTLHLDVGLFLMSTDTTVRVDGTSGTTGTEIDLKRDFDVGDQDRFRADGYWRFFRRHKLRFMYFDSSSTAERSLSRELHFGDAVYPVNAAARLEFDTQIIEGAYEYSFVLNDKFDLAASIGLHNISIDTKLSATTSAGNNGRSASLSSSADTNGPLPVIGLHAIWALNEKLYFDGYLQFFKVSIDNYDGRLTDYKLDFVWQPFRHFGMGLGYNQFTTRLDVSQDRFAGQLRLGYGGPIFFVTTAF